MRRGPEHLLQVNVQGARALAPDIVTKQQHATCTKTCFPAAGECAGGDQG